MMQQKITAWKPYYAQQPGALLLPWPSIRRAFPCTPGLYSKKTGAASRLVVRRRCQEKEEQSGNGGGKQKQQQEKRTFLSLEEAGLVEMSGLSTHERFLCRLTVKLPLKPNMFILHKLVVDG